MFFLAKTVFWLGLVFSVMPWPGGAPSDLAARSTSVAAGAAHEALAPLRAYCLRDPGACLAAVETAAVDKR